MYVAFSIKYKINFLKKKVNLYTFGLWIKPFNPTSYNRDAMRWGKVGMLINLTAMSTCKIHTLYSIIPALMLWTCLLVRNISLGYITRSRVMSLDVYCTFKDVIHWFLYKILTHLGGKCVLLTVISFQMQPF